LGSFVANSILLGRLVILTHMTIPLLKNKILALHRNPLSQGNQTEERRNM